MTSELPEASYPACRADLHEMHAREKLGMPDDWKIYLWEALPHVGATIYFHLVGSVAPIKSKGRYKGERDWKKEDKSTVRTVNISRLEHDAWLDCWEARTGKCRECVGRGQVVCRWSKAEGKSYAMCGVCGSTGKPVAKMEVVA